MVLSGLLVTPTIPRSEAAPLGFMGKAQKPNNEVDVFAQLGADGTLLLLRGS